MGDFTELGCSTCSSTTTAAEGLETGGVADAAEAAEEHAEASWAGSARLALGLLGAGVVGLLGRKLVRSRRGAAANALRGRLPAVFTGGVAAVVVEEDSIAFARGWGWDFERRRSSERAESGKKEKRKLAGEDWEIGRAHV